LARIDAAAARRAPFLISTPNFNFLVISRSDEDFRESLLDSELCPADGMPIVWISRLLGLPIHKRVSGADMLEALKFRAPPARSLTIFLFGGAAVVAAKAGRAINQRPRTLRCVGTLDPGFCSVEEMSRDDMIAEINASKPDFLAVSLGAQKGQ